MAGKERELHKFELTNGLTVVCEVVEGVESAAFSLIVRAGESLTSEEFSGTPALLAELFEKGCAGYDTIALSEKCEELGLHRGQSAGLETISCSGAVLGENIIESLNLIATNLLTPTFPADELQPIKELFLQELASLEDEPASKAGVEFNRLFYTAPFNRNSTGSKASLASINVEKIKDFYANFFKPNGAILSIVGAIEPEQIFKEVTASFGTWKKGAGVERVRPDIKLGQREHFEKESSQVQLIIGYAGAESSSSDIYTARVISSILSGGMSGRLFIEVREKRGLVYRVGASHSSVAGIGSTIVSAGTTPQKLNETIEVIMGVLEGLPNGVTDEELNRAKADLKTRVVLQSDSTSSRAGFLSSDIYTHGRIRSLDEIKNKIEAVDNNSIKDYLKKYQLNPYTLITLGPKGVEA